MAGGTIRERLEHKELKIFCGFSIVLLFLAGIVGMIKEGEGILSVFRGLWTIVISRDALITDYFGLAGYGAALMNAVLVMAMGLGRMLGFALPENFRNPYMATSVRDFYRRWHMTLGGWFRKYVYIPLGGNRRGEYRTVCHLLAVWILTSVWHGSTGNFLIWGMLLWLAIVIERQLEALGVMAVLEKVPGKLLCRLFVWVYIPITWVCFGITDIGQLQVFLGRMFHVVPGIRVSAGDWQKALENYGLLFLAGAIASTPLLKNLFRRFKDSWPVMALLAALFWLCVWRLQMEGHNPFMYLNF